MTSPYLVGAVPMETETGYTVVTLLNVLSSWLGIGSAVRSEKAFQETFLTVQELQCLSADIRQGTFTKNQLLTVFR